MCSPGYYGDPTGVFGDASPCVDCECNGNVDPSTNPICEHLNGTCINCTSNTYGRECERCRPGYYGDAVSVKNCTGGYKILYKKSLSFPFALYVNTVEQVYNKQRFNTTVTRSDKILIFLLH